MSAILHRQTELSEQLLLLYELGYSDPYMHHFSGTFNFKSHPDLLDDSDLPLLDIIAVCLTSGRPGDVVAVAFDKCEGICLVLAKHGPVLPEDETATNAFFSQVKAASSWMDLLPFLFSHSKANIEKQLLRLSQITIDLFSDLQLEIATYLDKSMEDEFPKSKAWRRFLYEDRQLTIKCILEDILHICRDESSAFNAQTNKASYTEYARVFGAAYTLLHSRFLDMLTGVSNHNIRLKLRAEKLKRRLGKVCQYSRLNKLIKQMKRFPDIPFRWLRDDLKGTGEGVFEICGEPTEAIERVLNIKLSPEQIEKITREFPRLLDDWAQYRSFNTCAHIKNSPLVGHQVIVDDEWLPWEVV
ncbi:hypothetical protein M422DRAFT_780449 [Sphaerobolus stellatus SS14]|uniref:Uncharacterized protein n=1 Tax=Sphaerobolus stellatus (strain SS14) TaxID=990650 RepID=A0A0C9VSB2_SPHS4|nr:hypothetical protein M422DRAFT_780449 [Sphaerobolus stellatus SS14]